MYYRKLKVIFLLFLIVTASACRKESLTDEDLSNSNLPVNIPSNPLDLDPGKPPVDTTKTIVVLGSSTAAGFGATKADSCWAGRLNGRLLTDKKGFKVVNLGVGGYTTYQLLPTSIAPKPMRPAVDTNKNVTAALKFRPALIIINLPSNDVGANFRDEEIMLNYRAIVRLIASNNIPYIITGTQPRNFVTVQQRKRLKTLNDKMISGFPGHIVDYLRKLSTPTYGLYKTYSAGDGIHLNNNGHKVVYQAIFNFPVFKTVASY
ncbi:SGNH/GDSL hydrolase family protein [Mucilaginibacter terrae]|uniref:SGNH/GDSL hydrolase family protein n=1 Tax=Mucilaginibacter terrae TaxID=1955052 RepID=UPI003625542B